MSLAVENFPQAAAPGVDPAESLSTAAQPILRELPSLLEYRSEADPDAEFIPKTVTGFGIGALAMGVTLLTAEAAIGGVRQSSQDIAMHFAFMVGIMFVSTSLLLVGLKVRADHSAVPLFSKHWLNSICTGGVFALLVWGPWALQNHAIMINRFLAAAIWMAVMSFPAIAAKWTIGPHTELPRPASPQN